MKMIKVAITGCTGYTGKKLVSYLAAHPMVSGMDLYSFTSAGKPFDELVPEMKGVVSPDLMVSHIDSLTAEADVYFLALPHGEAAKLAPKLVEAGKVVIDLSGDFRLDEASAYDSWYHFTHPSPELLASKSYALADWEGPSGSALISNPGCYPTATLLSVLPIVKAAGASVISVATSAGSGTSGAGKSANPDLLLSEMDGNVRAYNVHQHRHEPEIAQQMKKAGYDGLFSFTVHLLPLAVGMYATTSVFMNRSFSKQEVDGWFQEAYQNKPFIRLRSVPPQISWVNGTNFADIHVSVRNQSILIFTAIDNLVKGASGQAVQNMNLHFGWEPFLGLQSTGKQHVSVY
ncbi:MAG: N-acetyl-gamma-glutamyl-phosphate reductase [Bacteroidetes bacterium]|nr:N-acetyl-gamma-glutamyl-phosphate reductase [Bacteroidota bacterium]